MQLIVPQKQPADIRPDSGDTSSFYLESGISGRNVESVPVCVCSQCKLANCLHTICNFGPSKAIDPSRRVRPPPASSPPTIPNPQKRSQPKSCRPPVSTRKPSSRPPRTASIKPYRRFGVQQNDRRPRRDHPGPRRRLLLVRSQDRRTKCRAGSPPATRPGLAFPRLG
jgi:hypothetical protein